MDWGPFFQDVELPPVYRVRRRRVGPPPVDVPAEVDWLFRDTSCAKAVRPGMRVAVAVGSRGVSNLATAVRALVRNLRAAGAAPFIVPAMGSHGAATAQGQATVLGSLGVDEEGVGAPVVSTLETVRLGYSPSGVPVFFDAAAAGADGLVAINRIKPHTGFVGPVESGLCKMLAIGLGNQTGAGVLHAQGMAAFPRLIPEIGSWVARRKNLLFGVGLVEDHHHATVRVAFLGPEDLVEAEAELLEQARGLMSRIPVSHLHVLVVREIGKDISGEGMDPNVIGRYVTSTATPALDVQKIVVLDLSPGTGANANGIGLADITTRRLAQKTDYVPMYVNALTARYCEHVKMPLTMDRDDFAIKAAVRSLWGVSRPQDVKLAVIKNTLELDELWVSQAVLAELEGHADIRVEGEPFPLPFAENGDLLHA